MQIGEVRVTAQRPGNAGPWDGDEAKDDSLMCSLAEAGGAIAGGIGAGSLGLPPTGGAMAGKATAGTLLRCGKITPPSTEPTCEDAANHIVDLYIAKASDGERADLRRQRSMLVERLTGQCEAKKLLPAEKACIVAAETYQEAEVCSAKPTARE